MDSSKVSATQPYLGLPATAPSTELLMGRLGTYWRTLGITDPSQVQVLSEQAIRRATELPDMSGLDPLTQSLIAANDLLDARLAEALNLPRPSRELVAVRAVLLSGATPDWPRWLFAPSSETVAPPDSLRTAVAIPTPAPLPRAMPTQRIKPLSLLGLFRMLWRKLFSR